MKHFLILIFAVVMVQTPVNAQDYRGSLQKISQLNAFDTLQNPEYTNEESLLSRKVKDRKSRVVGSVKDIIINKFGMVDSLTIEFDRLRLQQDVTVSLENSSLSSSSGTYIFEAYDKEQIAELYPTFLDNIAVAAGEETDLVSVKSIHGANFVTEDGRVLGKVTDILFNDRGLNAKAIYVRMNNRIDTVSVPYDMVSFDVSGSANSVIIASQDARAVQEFLKTR